MPLNVYKVIGNSLEFDDFLSRQGSTLQKSFYFIYLFFRFVSWSYLLIKGLAVNFHLFRHATKKLINLVKLSPN